MTHPEDLHSTTLPTDSHFDSESDSEGSLQEEEHVTGDWKLVDLPEVPIVTGEEHEEEIVKLKVKLFRFKEEEWKERGVGNMKILKNSGTNLSRIVMRAEKTGRVLLNHKISSKNGFCKLETMKTSQKAWTWTAYDFSDETPSVQILCAKFLSQEDSELFKLSFSKALEVPEEKKEEKEDGTEVKKIEE